MLRIRLYVILLFFLFMSSCLTYRTVVFVLEFTDNFSSGKLTVTYENIRSSHKDPEKRTADFRELLELYEQDQFLLDQVREGIYVRERTLFTRGDTLIGRYSGIFERLNIDGHILDNNEKERFLTLELSSQQIIQSDANIVRDGDNVRLTWPTDRKKIWFSITETDPDTGRYSMIDDYHVWKK